MARRQQTGSIPLDARAIRRFLKVLEDGWSIRKASRITGISPQRWHRERRNNPHFSKRWDRAEEMGVLVLEEAAHKRAVKGVLKPIVSQGRIITHVREYSDGLLKTALTARSRKYAPHNPGDSAFEDSFVGAAETLLTALDTLFSKIEVSELPEGDARVGSNPQR